ncbi:Uncharacterised protein [Streptococcus pneumoniae]|nr:Uncharacterised protein [Streptococcus pneumoniae]
MTVVSSATGFSDSPSLVSSFVEVDAVPVVADVPDSSDSFPSSPVIVASGVSAFGSAGFATTGADSVDSADAAEVSVATGAEKPSPSRITPVATIAPVLNFLKPRRDKLPLTFVCLIMFIFPH